MFDSIFQSPNHLSVIHDQIKLTQSDLVGFVLGNLKTLKEKGVEKGSRIAVKLPNSPELLIHYLSALIGGHTIVPINPTIKSQNQKYILESTKVDLLIDAPCEMLHIAGDLPSFENSMALIATTSGSTAKPKFVCHSSEALIKNAMAFNEHVGMGAATNMYHIMPMSYMAGFLNTILCPILANGCVTIGKQFSPQNALTFWESALQNKCTTAWLSPTMLAILTRLARGEDLSKKVEAQFDHIFVGTAPLEDKDKFNFENKFNVRCLQSYGLTELLIIACQKPDDPSNVNNVGSILKGIEINPIREEETEENFEIQVRSDYQCLGYLDENGEKPIAYKKDAQFATGDIGQFVEGNNLEIKDRKKDLIIRGGMNISPRAIETMINEFPEILESRAVGMPHDIWGEEVSLFILAKEKSKFNMSEFETFCKQILDEASYPRKITLVDEFPRTITGKVLNRKLLDLIS